MNFWLARRSAGLCGRLGFICCFPLSPANPEPKICFLALVSQTSPCGLPFSMTSVGKKAHIYFQCGKPGSPSSRDEKGPSSQLLVLGKAPLTDLLAIPSQHLVIRPKVPSP